MFDFFHLAESEIRQITLNPDVRTSEILNFYLIHDSYANLSLTFVFFFSLLFASTWSSQQQSWTRSTSGSQVPHQVLKIPIQLLVKWSTGLPHYRSFLHRLGAHALLSCLLLHMERLVMVQSSASWTYWYLVCYVKNVALICMITWSSLLRRWWVI